MNRLETSSELTVTRLPAQSIWCIGGPLFDLCDVMPDDGLPFRQLPPPVGDFPVLAVRRS